MAKNLGTLTIDLIANIAGFTSGMDSASRAASKANSSISVSVQQALNATQKALMAYQKDLEKVNKAIADIEASGKPATDAMKARAAELEKSVEKIGASAKAQQSAVDASNQRRERLVKLLETERGQTLLNADATRKATLQTSVHAVAAGKLAISQGQLANANRMLPAQFTDIAVSLASGQKPYMVLLQQGGQLKDSYNGVALAAKSMATYIAGLVNPYTVAAAAVGTLAVAWYSAAEDSSAYTKALVVSGNAAGVTEAQLASMTEQIASTGSVTTGAARDAVVAVASSGSIAAENIQAVATAAASMQELTGQAIDKTVSDFAKLADDPVKAVLELNNSQHFLTLEIYEQIKALQDQGKYQDAARIATEAASQSAVEALKRVQDSKNGMLKFWQDIKVSASGAWEAMKGAIGAQSAADELQTLLAANKVGVQNIKSAQSSGDDATVLAESRAVMKNSARIQEILKSTEGERAKARLDAANAAAVTVEAGLDSIIDSQATKEQKKLRESAKVTQDVDAAIQKARAAGQISVAENLEAKKKQALDAIEKKYAETPTKTRAPGKTKTDGNSLYRSYEDELLKYQRIVDTTNISTGELSKTTKEQDAIFDTTKGKLKDLTQAQKDDIVMKAKAADAVLALKDANEKNAKAVDDYKSLVKELNKEDGLGLDQAKDRLKILNAGYAAGAANDSDYTKSAYKAIEQVGTENSSSNYSGPDAKYGGSSGEFGKIDKAVEEENKSYQARLDALAAFRQSRSDLNQQWDDEEAKLQKEHQQTLTDLDASRNQVLLSAAQEGFGSVTDILKTSLGEQSAAYKAAFIVQKAAAIAQSIVAIQAGLAQASANPFPENIAAMASVAAATASIISTISAVGMAHDGIDSVPQDGTWLLQKGERVTTAATSAKLDATLDRVAQNTVSGAGDTNNFNFNVNGSLSDRERQMMQTTVARAVKQAKQETASEYASGTGDISRAARNWTNKRRVS